MYNRKDLFNLLKASSLFSGFRQEQVDGLNIILKEAEKRSTPVAHLAYILATTYHETNKTMQPIKELGGQRYLKSKKYYPYVGMGYVQLTWKDNYLRAGKKLGIDLISKPEKAMVPKYAVQIMFDGMTEGWFTSKKLSDYLSFEVSKEQYVLCRYIINGRDKRNMIANYAVEFHKALEDSIGAPTAPVVTDKVVGHTKDGTPLWWALIKMIIKLFTKRK